MCDLCLDKRFVCCIYPAKHYIMATRIIGLAGSPPFVFNTTDISGLANKWKNWKVSFEI